MRLFELTQVIDEGPRQDRVAELFTELLPVYEKDGPKAFRALVIRTLMDEFNISVANAVNVYTGQMKKGGIAGLSNAERRASAGKAPVAARVKGGINSVVAPAEIGAAIDSGIPADEAGDDAEIKSILRDTEQFDLNGESNGDDDIEWDRIQDTDGNLVIEWTLQYYHNTAVGAMKENGGEVSHANHQLAAIGQKYRNRVVSYTPATVERATADDSNFKGKAETIRRLRGRLILKI